MRYFLFLIFILLCSCSRDLPNENIETIQQPIINGNPGTHLEFPSIVAIMRGRDLPDCTGTFIKKDLIITAKHCVENYSLDELSIVHGQDWVHAKSVSFDDIPIISKAVYPGEGDLALLMVKDIIPEVEPVDILHHNQYYDILQSGDPVIIAGYGRHVKDEAGNKLYYGESVVNYRNFISVIVGECDNDVPSGCYGDSGGPLYIQCNGIRYLGGVSHGGTEKDCEKAGSIYTLPGWYLTWINETYEVMGNMADQPCNDDCLIGVDQGIVCEPNEKEIECAGCAFSSKKDNTFLAGLLLGAFLALARIKI
jgi:V8-like Glu-specific endopeptidase